MNQRWNMMIRKLKIVKKWKILKWKFNVYSKFICGLCILYGKWVGVSSWHHCWDTVSVSNSKLWFNVANTSAMLQLELSNVTTWIMQCYNLNSTTSFPQNGNDVPTCCVKNSVFLFNLKNTAFLLTAWRRIKYKSPVLLLILTFSILNIFGRVPRYCNSIFIYT